MACCGVESLYTLVNSLNTHLTADHMLDHVMTHLTSSGSLGRCLHSVVTAWGTHCNLSGVGRVGGVG